MPTAAIADIDRRDLIAARQRRSLAWRLIHRLGSLKLALLLLATIAVACAIATFCESRFDTKVAQAYIYKAPWFAVWLGVLCVNLFAVTLTRWPWQRKHLGFVITHYGIITLLIGAMIGSHFGFEGNVTLHRGAPPLDRVVTSRSVVQIQNLAAGAYLASPFDAELARPTEARPRRFPVPASKSAVLVDAYAASLGLRQRLVPDESPAAPPGLTLELATTLMGQRLTLPLLLGAAPQDLSGLARIAFVPELPARPPFRGVDTRIVFAKFAPVIQGESGAATGIDATLSSDGKTLTATLPDGKSARLELALGRPQPLGNATLTVLESWPDFTLVNGKPSTASDRPNNPAILLRVEAPRRPRPGENLQPRLELAPAAGGGVAYQLSRGEYAASRGAAKLGQTFPLGWADWTATLAASLPHARLEEDRRPPTPGETAAPGPPGLRARLVAPDGRSGPPRWIASGETTLLDPNTRLGYGLESRSIPFTIALKNFEVPRLEGTDTPANFIATVEFRDPQTSATKPGVAQMNHPASWPGTPFALLTGLNYKFSQAQWNPQDLGETTLQVLYDPGWLLKWTGSLAICTGIFIMFYLRPKKP